MPDGIRSPAPATDGSDEPLVAASLPLRSKAIAAWLAVLAGPLGVHRLYVHGRRDAIAWCQAAASVAGVVGVQRMRHCGQDDAAAQWLVPLLGVVISLSMATAIVWALTPDERWNERHNAGRRPPPSGWSAVLAAVVALMVGGAVLMGTIAYSVQKFFEWQLQP